MKLTTPLAVAMVCVWGSGAMADGLQPMAYQEFAAKVPHLPLAECPAVVKATDATCHVAMIDDKLHVLAFANSGDHRLVAVVSEAGGRRADTFRISALD